MSDPIQKLAEIYPTLENGQKAAAREVKAAIEEMQAELTDLKSSLDRQPLPEAPVSMTAKVVHAATQIEWLVTVREVRAARLLISAMPIINEVLAEQGLIAFDAYVDSRRAERGERGALRVESGETGESESRSTLHASPSTLSFKAETLEKSTKGDKTYYKIKGGKFTKFGVTVWPEVLADAGFDLDTLAGVTGMAGYTAHYILNEKGDPNKVIGLQPS